MLIIDMTMLLTKDILSCFRVPKDPLGHPDLPEPEAWL